VRTVRLLRVAEVVARLGLSERTIRKMIADGRLPGVRPLGVRAVRVPEDVVQAFLGMPARRVIDEDERETPRSAAPGGYAEPRLSDRT